MSAATVIGALRRFLPGHARAFPRLRGVIGEARRRAVWAITHCRTGELGGHLHVCDPCGTREFHPHSCNHRSCPQCGNGATAEWVEKQLARRVGAPYFMVTFTLPEQLRPLFSTDAAKRVYQAFFSAASSSLSSALANPKWLGAKSSGFTMVLHTWNQRLHFHPHIHTIVPGAGIGGEGRDVNVKNAGFLVPQPALREIFRARFRDALHALTEEETGLPPIDPAVWQKDWGVDIRPFGGGEGIIKYLGRYVCRTAIGDPRIVGVTDTGVSFRWKDRANGGVERIETVDGVEFVSRYLRHVLPRGMRAVRDYGYLHPAAKAKHEIVTVHTGRPLLIGAAAVKAPKPPHAVACRCCGAPMRLALRVAPPWRPARPPPPAQRARA